MKKQSSREVDCLTQGFTDGHEGKSNPCFPSLHHTALSVSMDSLNLTSNEKENMFPLKYSKTSSTGSKFLVPQIKLKYIKQSYLDIERSFVTSETFL